MKEKKAEFYKAYSEYYVLFKKYLQDFPKDEKFGIMKDIEKANNDFLTAVIELMHKHYKKTQAVSIGIALEKMKMYLHISKSLDYFDRNAKKSNEERFLRLSNKIHELSVLAKFWLNNKES